VSLPTVYAALELLADLGVALRVHAGRAVRYDPRSEAHHHLVCTSCGAVTDLDAELDLGPAIERARALGAEASGAEVTVRGLCADCAG
jgi:Fe2+ or Zn2+ uptake regulation protein